MPISDFKQQLTEIESQLSDLVFVSLHIFDRNGRKLNFSITKRFYSECKKGKVWKSKQMLTALKNAAYGFDEKHMMSPGGADGIFLLTRTYKPKNQMMTKLFDYYIDKPGSGAGEVADKLGTSLDRLFPVRLVSHHMRLLGLLKQSTEEDILVLVDYDDSE